MPTLQVKTLWIERAAAYAGFNRLAERLGLPATGAFLFTLVVVLFHLPVLSAVGWLQTGTLSFVSNPGEVFQVVAWPVMVWILLRTKVRYRTAINGLPDAIDADLEELDIEGRLIGRLLTAMGVPENPTGKTDADLDVLVHQPVRYVVLGVGLAVYWAQLLTNPAGLIGPVAELAGQAVAVVRFYVIIPFVLYPIGAEFLAAVVGALVVLPFKIERATLINFSDPHGYAGLVPAGILFKSVSVFYFVLLTLFAVFQTIAAGTSPTDLFSSGLLITGLAVGLVLFFGPMLWIKSYLAAAKGAKIEALADTSRAVGSTDELFPYAEPESTDDASQYTYNYIRMEWVQATSEFPIEFAMVQEVLFALVLPYVTSLLFNYALRSAV
ncbi:hypothetical protein [Halarchaeum acidiphilum]|nr:hypothetical protein [Halarchaeum acidiphilum]